MMEYGILHRIPCTYRTEAVHTKNCPHLSGNTARLYEKHEVISKQENMHSVPSWTSSEPIIVIFLLRKRFKFEVDVRH